MRKEWLVLVALAVNALLALLCVIRFWVTDRKKGLLFAAVILCCPLGGVLYLLVSDLLQKLLNALNVSREELSFRTDRSDVVLPADEEEEMNVASMQETLLVSDVSRQRRAVLSALKRDLESSLSAVTVALQSEDTEISHYAASAISDEVAKFKVAVQQLSVEMEQNPENVDLYVESAGVISGFLDQNVLSEMEERTYVYRHESILEWLYQKQRAAVTGDMYRQVVERMLREKDHDKAVLWTQRAAENLPGELAAYRLQLELYYATGEREPFFRTLEELKQSGIPLDQETLELVRYFR